MTKKKNDSAPVDQRPTPAAVDATPLDTSAFKHENGGFHKILTVEEIIAKSKSGVKLVKEEVSALRAAGLKKDGSKLTMPTGPKTPSALNSDQLYGAVKMFGAEQALAHAFRTAETDEGYRADLMRSAKALLKRLKDTEDANAIVLADSLFNEIRKHVPTFGTRGVSSGTGRSRGDDYGVTSLNRAIVNMAVIGGGKGDRYTVKQIEHEGVKGLFLSLTGEKEDLEEETAAPAVDEASPFGNADPAVA